MVVPRLLPYPLNHKLEELFEKFKLPNCLLTFRIGSLKYIRVRQFEILVLNCEEGSCWIMSQFCF